MSRKNFSEMSVEERATLAARVKPLRQEAGMTQAELAEAAGVSRATVNTLESGSKTPQGDKLEKVLNVFGLQDKPDFEDQTEIWLTLMGTLIEAIPEKRREPIVSSAIRVLGRGVRNDVSTPHEDDYDFTPEGPSQSDLALAAMEGKKKADESHAE